MRTDIDIITPSTELLDPTAQADLADGSAGAPGALSIDYAGAGLVARVNATKIVLIVGGSVVVLFAGLGSSYVLCQRCFGPTYQPRVPYAKQEMSSLSGDLELFQQDIGRYPTTKEGLAALRVRPTGLAGWHGPYANHDIIDDPWDHPYIYRCPGTRNPSGFDLMSRGPDGIEGTSDDVAGQ